LQNAKLLEELELSVSYGRSLVGLLSLSLKVLDLSVSLGNGRSDSFFFGRICEELEALAGHNMLEALGFQVYVAFDGTTEITEDFIGSTIQKVENPLVKPGWSALKEVSLRLHGNFWDKPKLYEALQSLPDKYFSHLSKLESVAFDYAVL
jgi:hypothetical protein